MLVEKQIFNFNYVFCPEMVIQSWFTALRGQTALCSSALWLSSSWTHAAAHWRASWLCWRGSGSRCVYVNIYENIGHIKSSNLATSLMDIAQLMSEKAKTCEHSFSSSISITKDLFCIFNSCICPISSSSLCFSISS